MEKGTIGDQLRNARNETEFQSDQFKKGWEAALEYAQQREQPAPTPESRWPTEMIELVKIVLPHVSCYYEGEYNPDVRVASEELQFLIDNLTQSKAPAPTEEAIDYFDKMETLIGYLKLALDKQYKVPTELGEVIFEAEQFVKEKKACAQWLQTSAGTREGELEKCLGEFVMNWEACEGVLSQDVPFLKEAKSILSKSI